MAVILMRPGLHSEGFAVSPQHRYVKPIDSSIAILTHLLSIQIIGAVPLTDVTSPNTQAERAAHRSAAPRRATIPSSRAFLCIKEETFYPFGDH